MLEYFGDRGSKGDITIVRENLRVFTRFWNDEENCAFSRSWKICDVKAAIDDANK